MTDNLKQSSHNCFTSALMDRMTDARRNESWVKARMGRPNALFVPVWRGMNLFEGADGCKPLFLDLTSVRQMIADDIDNAVFLGMSGDRFYFAIDIPSENTRVPDALSGSGRFQDIKTLGTVIDRGHAEILIFAKGITYWHRHHLFCPKCSSPTESREGGHQRVCINESCRKQQFPRTDPAIIVLVTHGDHCLLARQPVWKSGRYSTIAGFVEPGESIEHAVVREVAEETGIHVNKVTYHSSQPWPFPCSIMLGFAASAINRSIQVDGHEIEDAGWFSRKDICRGIKERRLFLPPRVSISYSLIENWFNRGKEGLLAEMMNPDEAW